MPCSGEIADEEGGPYPAHVANGGRQGPGPGRQEGHSAQDNRCRVNFCVRVQNARGLLAEYVAGEPSEGAGEKPAHSLHWRGCPSLRAVHGPYGRERPQADGISVEKASGIAPRACSTFPSPNSMRAPLLSMEAP